jgi:hypothetical protein
MREKRRVTQVAGYPQRPGRSKRRSRPSAAQRPASSHIPLHQVATRRRSRVTAPMYRSPMTGPISTGPNTSSDLLAAAPAAPDLANDIPSRAYGRPHRPGLSLSSDLL